MDNTVIILIGAGVSCVVIGFALFVKLAKMGSQEESEASGNKKLLADDYAENFQECFENTGNIEDTLEQLADIYTGNQYMYNLIINALNFLKEDQGDYETALEGINVDSDTNITANDIIKNVLQKGLVPKKAEERFVTYMSSINTDTPIAMASDVIKTGIFNIKNKKHTSSGYDGGKRRYELELGRALIR